MNLFIAARERIKALWLSVPSKDYVVDARVSLYECKNKTSKLNLFFNCGEELILKPIAMNLDWVVDDHPIIMHYAKVDKDGTAKIEALQSPEYRILMDKVNRDRFGTSFFTVDKRWKQKNSQGEDVEVGSGTPIQFVDKPGMLKSREIKIKTLTAKTLQLSRASDLLGKEISIANLPIEYPPAMSIEPSRPCPPLMLHVVMKDSEGNSFEQRYPATVDRPAPGAPVTDADMLDPVLNSIHTITGGYKIPLLIDVAGMTSRMLHPNAKKQ